ncbi:uncharacterized protein LOC659327 [Tribolium castaneum]|uniref:uncharacterized protein LOC659327 n=1 Tax=Tribolium castaneum TaxID=7070 RepID=UPI0030FECF5B
MKLVFLVFVSIAVATKLPPNFKKCNRTEPDLEKCVLEAARDGLKQLTRTYKKIRLPNLEPLDVVELSARVETRLIHFSETLRNCKFWGLSRSVLEKFDEIFRFNLDEKVIKSQFIVPEVRTKCSYQIDGTIMSVPIRGKGNSSIIFKHFNVTLYVPYDEITKRNKTYGHVTSCEIDGKPESIHFQLDNLFNGDEEAGKRVNQLLNDNWSELYDDIKDDYLKMGKQMLIQLLNGFFSKLSLEEAFVFGKNIYLRLIIMIPQASNFQKCNRKQADLKQCVIKAAQDAIYQLTHPYNEVNIPNLNPFELKGATVGGGGAVAVEQRFTDCKLQGFNKMKLDKFEFDFDKKVLDVVGTFPEIVKKCTYEVDGQVLLLPVTGKGPSEIILTKVDVTSKLYFEEIKKRNKTFIKIVRSDIDMNPGHVSYKFDNLFNGDKVLGDNINQVLNDNWKEVFEDVKSGYIEIIKTIVTSLLNNFFSKVSIEEAFD